LFVISGFAASTWQSDIKSVSLPMQMQSLNYRRQLLDDSLQTARADDSNRF
jgi:hypothetical protein